MIFQFRAGTETREWRLERAELAGMIEVTKTVNEAGKTELTITPNRENFRAYLEQIAATIQREPVNAQLEFNPETNQLLVRQESQEGRSLDVEAALEQVMALKNSPTHRVELPVVVIPPSNYRKGKATSSVAFRL